MPVHVNAASIRSKVLSYMQSSQYKADMKGKISQLRKSGKDGDELGLDIVSVPEMEAALQALIRLLRSYAGGLPSSVAAHFDLLTASGVSIFSDDSGASATVSFGGDLSRPSLVRSDGSSAGGIEDIVMLFDQGYSASSRVYGYYSNWGALKRDPSEGPSGDMVIVSRQSRPGLGFLEAAIDAFNAQYGSFAHASLG